MFIISTMFYYLLIQVQAVIMIYRYDLELELALPVYEDS